MRSRQIRDRALSRARPLSTVAGTTVALLFLLEQPAWAIPSPDLVVSLFASSAQALGLATLLLARWTFGGRSSGALDTQAKSSGRSYRTAFQVTLGLFLASLVGWGLFYAHQEDLKTQRLQVNLNRNSVENGKLIGDVNLKTLSYSDQVKREDGFRTEDIVTWLATGVEEPLWDVREPEEFEVGAIAGTRHVRYPDLLAEPEKYLEAGKTSILLCFNGNRSSELCDALLPLGYPCRFMIGGYEKWNAEERPLALNAGYRRDDLREIPDYPNKEVLLDTPVVHELVKKENALFVDLRYPGEFEGLGHLPDAVNLPFRSLTTPDLELALEALPRRPIIAVCYDKRSSFYGLILGCRLARLGHDYRGRYTVPEEYYVPSQSKAYVAAWEEAQRGKTLLAIAAEPLRFGLDRLQALTGDLALAILALVAFLRLALLPITWKAERDRRVQQGLSAAIRRARERTRGDARAASRAILGLYRSHGVRPVVNFLGTAFQLVLFLLFFSVVDSTAGESQEGFLWIDALAEPDPWLVLPIAAAAGVVAQLALVAKKRSLLRALLWLAVGGGLLALILGLNAGAQLYLCASLVWVVAQTALAGCWLTRDRQSIRARQARRLDTRPAVPLGLAHRIAGCGNKAARLGALVEAGLPVPAGFVLRDEAVEAWRTGGGWRSEDLRTVRRELGRLGAARVAVRSSGLNEDGAEASYAGVFESVLSVRPDGIEGALERVARSLGSTRAARHSRGRSEGGGIVVQAMVDARYAGVLFTEHPGASGAMLVELVAGLGEGLVGGRDAPQSFRYGRHGGTCLDDARPPIALEPLIDLGRKVERLFGKPQDIEWAFAGGRFWLLQARDITRHSRRGSSLAAVRERERARLLSISSGADAHEEVFVQNELTELLPSPTPFSLALMDSLWAWNGSTDLACRALGVPYEVDPDSPPYAVSVFGSLYVHRREQLRRLRKEPGVVASFRLSRSADRLERSFREEFLPRFLRGIRLREALDLSRLGFEELLELCSEVRRSFVRETYVQAEIVNVAAEFYFKVALRELAKRGLDPADHLGHIPVSAAQTAMRIVAEVGAGRAKLSDFLDIFGHRAPLDYEVASPRYRENPELATAMAARSASPNGRHHSPPPLPEGKVLGLTVERARRFAALKEDAKHHALRELAFLRAIVCEIGTRLGVGRGVFHLLPEEIEQLAEPGFRDVDARDQIRVRQWEEQAWRGLELPAALTPALLESLSMETRSDAPAAPCESNLRGLRVSGHGDVCGRVRVLREASEIDAFEKHEILVARFTDPTWLPVFPLARGIVTEVGGWLSHAAIQAREHEMTAIVGTTGALSALKTGDLVHLGSDGSVEQLAERRAEGRRRVDVEVRLRRAQSMQPARLGDLSERGALLVFPDGPLAIGEGVVVESRGGTEWWPATVVRNGTPGEYGILFEVSTPGAVSSVAGLVGGS